MMTTIGLLLAHSIPGQLLHTQTSLRYFTFRHNRDEEKRIPAAGSSAVV